MKDKIKEHTIIFLLVTIVVYLFTSYIQGTLNPFNLYKDTRESQMMVFIYLQVLVNYCWFNRENIIKKIKK